MTTEQACLAIRQAATQTVAGERTSPNPFQTIEWKGSGVESSLCDLRITWSGEECPLSEAAGGMRAEAKPPTSTIERDSQQHNLKYSSW